MSRLAAAAAMLVVLPGLLAGCAAAPVERTDQGGPFTVDVDVDTPQLRAIKRQGGVEPCPNSEARDAPASRPANSMPGVVLPCLGGGPDVDLGSMTGPLVINLWAQWCGSCRDELPYYQRLHEEAGDKVQVLGIDYQDTRPEAALELVREAGVTFPLLADPAGQVRIPFKVRGLPGAIFVDRDGSVTDIEYVVIRSYEQLTALVEERLGVTV